MIVLNKTYLLLLIYICAGFTAAAQQSPSGPPANWCGTNSYSPWLNWYHDHKSSFADMRDADTSWYYIPVTIHLVGTTQGFGHYPEAGALRILCDMNEQYESVRFRFYLHPEDPFIYHNNSSWMNHDWDGGAQMINQTRIDDRLNAYIVENPAGNCGYS